MRKTVAPYAGAWIETPESAHLLYFRLSLPTRERGLKLTALLALVGRNIVAPYAGAWIETEYCIIFGGSEQSLPTRERGLKLRIT